MVHGSPSVTEGVILLVSSRGLASVTGPGWDYVGNRFWVGPSCPYLFPILGLEAHTTTLSFLDTEIELGSGCWYGKSLTNWTTPPPAPISIVYKTYITPHPYIHFSKFLLYRRKALLWHLMTSTFNSFQTKGRFLLFWLFVFINSSLRHCASSKWHWRLFDGHTLPLAPKDFGLRPSQVSVVQPPGESRFWGPTALLYLRDAHM